MAIRVRPRGDLSGGILSLTRFISEHRGALEYDLLTRTGFELADVGRSLSWRALDSFMHNLPTDTATMRELHPEYAEWNTTMKTNALLADIYDVLSVIGSVLIALRLPRAKVKLPKPYPRPGQKPKEQMHFGRGALPPDKLREWIKEKRRKHHGHD